jgi:hypothetical protein
MCTETCTADQSDRSLFKIAAEHTVPPDDCINVTISSTWILFCLTEICKGYPSEYNLAASFLYPFHFEPFLHLFIIEPFLHPLPASNVVIRTTIGSFLHHNDSWAFIKAIKHILQIKSCSITREQTTIFISHNCVFL